MQYNVKQVISDGKVLGYTCKAKGEHMVGFGRGIEKAITDFVLAYEYYTLRPHLLREMQKGAK